MIMATTVETALLMGILLVFIAVVLHFTEGDGDEGPEFPDPIAEIDFDETPAEVEGVPELNAVTRVNTHRDGEGIYVPTVWMAIDDREVAWEYVAWCVEDLADAFEETHIRQFEFHCMSDEDGDAFCYKTTISPEQADKFRTDPAYTKENLWTDVKRGDDGDDGVPPVYWQACDEHQAPSDVSGGGGGGAGAAAAAAGGAAGGACGAAGGAC